MIRVKVQCLFTYEEIFKLHLQTNVRRRTRFNPRNMTNVNGNFDIGLVCSFAC